MIIAFEGEEVTAVSKREHGLVYHEASVYLHIQAKEGNKAMNVVELMDIFWKILEQNAKVKDSGRVPLEGDPVMAWWRIKPYLNTDTYAGGGSSGGK